MKVIAAASWAAIAAAIAGNASAANLTVQPSDGLVDRPFIAHVAGVRAGAHVEIRARLVDDKGQAWTSVGLFEVEADGNVDSSRDPAIGGTYSGITPGGLACSALPVEHSELAHYISTLSNKPGATSPSVGDRPSFRTDVVAAVDGRRIGSVSIVRRYLADDAVTQDVEEGKIRGVLFTPRRTTGIPVLVIGGSGGGVPRAQAELLASRGHPALAIAYFAYKDLPIALANIPIETFADGAEWLAKRTGVERVAIMGTSRGSEAIQLTAAYFPEHIAALVAFVPAPMIARGLGPGVDRWQAAWTIGGRPVPFVSAKTEAEQSKMAAAMQSESKAPPGYVGAPFFLANWTDPIAYELYGTPVARINVPIFLIGGEDDAMWPSAFGARKISQRMAALGKGNLVEVHTYPGAGHGISQVGISSMISGSSIHPITKQWVSTGGQTEAQCQASYDAWAKTLDFLGRMMVKPSPTMGAP